MSWFRRQAQDGPRPARCSGCDVTMCTPPWERPQVHLAVKVTHKPGCSNAAAQCPVCVK